MDNNKKSKAPKDKDSSTKHARGSKNVHSEHDNSTEDGFKPNKKKKK
ncbi:hypothetical protein [Aegicerativicinus sediminis]|nr:hypothetical protein [Aegicerativicinus sediminis]